MRSPQLASKQNLTLQQSRPSRSSTNEAPRQTRLTLQLHATTDQSLAIAMLPEIPGLSSNA